MIFVFLKQVWTIDLSILLDSFFFLFTLLLQLFLNLLVNAIYVFNPSIFACGAVVQAVLGLHPVYVLFRLLGHVTLIARTSCELVDQLFHLVVVESLILKSVGLYQYPLCISEELIWWEYLTHGKV